MARASAANPNRVWQDQRGAVFAHGRAAATRARDGRAQRACTPRDGLTRRAIGRTADPEQGDDAIAKFNDTGPCYVVT